MQFSGLHLWLYCLRVNFAQLHLKAKLQLLSQSNIGLIYLLLMIIKTTMQRMPSSLYIPVLHFPFYLVVLKTRLQINNTPLNLMEHVSFSIDSRSCSYFRVKVRNQLKIKGNLLDPRGACIRPNVCGLLPFALLI